MRRNVRSKILQKAGVKIEIPLDEFKAIPTRNHALPVARSVESVIGNLARMTAMQYVSCASTESYAEIHREQATPTNRVQRERLQTLAKQNRWAGVTTGTDEILTHLGRIRGARFSVDGQDLDERVMDTAERIWGHRAASGRTELYPGSRACLGKMIRIFFGLTLYMRTLLPGSPHIARLPPLPRLSTPDRKVITDRAEVFSVLSRWTLTRDERLMLGLEGTVEESRMMEMSWHFRQLHWRQRPGQGQDPLALREVFADWTLVRRDRMPTDLGLPSGGDATV